MYSCLAPLLSVGNNKVTANWPTKLIYKIPDQLHNLWNQPGLFFFFLCGFPVLLLTAGNNKVTVKRPTGQSTYFGPARSPINVYPNLFWRFSWFGICFVSSIFISFFKAFLANFALEKILFVRLNFKRSLGPSDIVNKTWPQILIRWHQKLISWHQFKFGTKN